MNVLLIMVVENPSLHPSDVCTVTKQPATDEFVYKYHDLFAYLKQQKLEL